MNPAFDPAQLPLRDIHLPTSIGWWPPAFGWWLLGALVLAGVAWGLVCWWRGRVRRAALRQLRGLVAALHAGAAPLPCVQQAGRILRRYSMTVAADPSAVAGLAGEAWLEYLDRRWRRGAFAHGAGRLLTQLPYAPSAPEAEALSVAELCMAWIREQREPQRRSAVCGS
jgi:hypothetical protein